MNYFRLFTSYYFFKFTKKENFADNDKYGILFYKEKFLFNSFKTGLFYFYLE